MAVRRDEPRVTGGVEEPRVVNLSRGLSLAREGRDEGSELRVGDRVTSRADDHDVVVVPRWVERERTCREALRLTVLRGSGRASVRGQVAGQEQRDAGEREHERSDPGAD